jgi:hypothetical protein
MSTSTARRDPPRIAPQPAPDRVRGFAAVTAAIIAALYLAIYAGLLSVGRAEAGELGILGVAGGLFVVLAVALWRVRSRVLWAGVAGLQVLLAAMYVAVAPERDPAFEVWGILIRVLSVILVAAMVTLLLDARRR